MSDQGFHEIQLNGKQLVFLFMAATVVSVVIFLFGVMVGRGARPALATATEQGTLAGDIGDPDFPAGPVSPGNDIPGANEVTPTSPAQAPENAPTPVQDDEHYDFDARLTEQKPPDRLEPAPEPARPRVEKPGAPASARASTPAPARESPSAAGRPQPGTYAVQLVAVRERADADAVAKRLVGKGYSAYVLMPSSGGAPVYRVQVGRYKTRGEAEKAAARLRAEEKFKPWVTR